MNHKCMRNASKITWVNVQSQSRSLIDIIEEYILINQATTTGTAIGEHFVKEYQ